LTGTDQHDGIDELIRMVDRKYARTKGGNILNSDNLDVTKKDAQNGMKKHLDGKVQQVLHFFDKDINEQQHTDASHVPRVDKRKDVQNNLDGINGIDS